MSTFETLLVAGHLAQADALQQSLMARYFGEAGESVGAGSPRPGRGNRAPTQNLPIATETPPPYTPGGQAALPAANPPVPARLLAAMQPGCAYARAHLLATTSISEADWIWAIRPLKEERP